MLLVGAVCQVRDDPFIFTVKDLGGLFGLSSTGAQMQFIDLLNDQLTDELNDCLPPGYNVEGVVRDLRIVRQGVEGKTLRVAGSMGGGASKNPA